MILLLFTLLFWVHVYKPFLFCLSRENTSAFVEELVWWCWILSAFACLESFWFLLHIWMRSLLGTVIWAVGYFLSSLCMSCHSLLAWRVSIERSAIILMGIPLCVIYFFSLAAFKFVLCVWSLLIWLICVFRCYTFGLSSLRLSGFLGLGWLFPSPF